MASSIGTAISYLFRFRFQSHTLPVKKTWLIETDYRQQREEEEEEEKMKGKKPIDQRQEDTVKRGTSFHARDRNSGADSIRE